MEDLTSSFLYAVQQIPGETREEKFKEIGRIVNCVIKIIKDESVFTSAISHQNVPNALVPLIKVLVGVKIKSHEFVIEALKSDDFHLIVEALRARWFYDGTNKSITNFSYFSTELLPYVSMSTRREIVKKLAVGLVNSHDLAEEFFNGFVSFYGLPEATNLLPACSSDFIYEAIVKHGIVLSNKLVKILYRKYPDLTMRYLQFLNPYERKNDIDRVLFRMIDINDYEHFMPLLINKHPEVFVDMQEICHTSPHLGNRRTMMFLKNAKDVMIKRPRDIIELMPIKLVYDNLKEEEFETMFGNILEDRWDMFNIDETLNYLEYYPHEKKVTLIKNKVKEKYGFDLLEKVEKMTTNFLMLLPEKERHVVARRVIEVRHKVHNDFDSEASWWCYLPVEEAVPALKLQIVKNWKSNKRQKLFSQLIYVCKLGKSEEALLDVLQFVDGYHKNERPDVICGMLDRITQEFDLNTFDRNYFELLFNIIKRIRLKKENARDYWVLTKILKKYVHYCYCRELPADEIIDLIVRLFVEGRVGVSWKLLEDEAQYERKYLDVCLNHSFWLNMDYKKNCIEGIYNFNERHVTSNNNIQRLSIKDYPQLLSIVEETLKKEQNKEIAWVIYTKEKLKKHEPELYESWFPQEEDSPSEIHEDISIDAELGDDEEEEKSAKSVPEVKEKIIYVTEAIIALKRNFSEIKENWPRYYECCKNEMSTKKRRRVKNFLKALRWYQDIPIKFVEKALEEKNFSIMGYILDGATFSLVARNVLPKVNDENHSVGYLNALHVTAAIRNTTSPISVELVQEYLTANYMYSYKNYINDGLKLWSYVSYRTSLEKMTELMKVLSKDRLFLRRHAIRLMYTIASRNCLVDFYRELWVKEEHPRIRQLLAEKIGRLFSKRPSDDTWNLLSLCIDDLSICEDDNLLDLMGARPVPVAFASVFAEKIFDKLKFFAQKGMPHNDSVKLLDQLFDYLSPDCTDQLSDEFYRNVIAYYLQNIDTEVIHADRFIVKVYLNSSSVHFQSRFRYFGQILYTESERWYSLDMEKRKSTPCFIDNIIQIVVCQVQKFKGNLELVESLLKLFLTIFTPYQYAWSQIMLFLCAEYMRVETSFKQFGINLSESINCLIKKYTTEYFMQVVELVREFVCNFSFYEYSMTIKNRLNFLEGLIEKGNLHGSIIAAKLLNQKIVSEYDRQHCEILERLSKVNNPIVQSLL